MFRRWGARLAAVLVVALGGVWLAGPALALGPVTNPQDGQRSFVSTAGLSYDQSGGWTPGATGIGCSEAGCVHQAAIMLSTVNYSATTDALLFKFAIQYVGPADGVQAWVRAEHYTWCGIDQTSTGGIKVGDTFEGDPVSSSSKHAESLVLPANCPADHPFLMGIGFLFEVGLSGSTPIYAYREWTPDGQIHPHNYPSDPAFCATKPDGWAWVGQPNSGFGPCGMVSGGLGGGTVFNDPNPVIDHSTFANACPSPPAATWSSFDWLGPWVGYYAYCLFVPQDGIILNPVYGSVQHTGYTDVFNIYGAIRSNVSWPGGQCGTLTTISILGGPAIALSTCGSPWNQFGVVRDLLGVGVIIVAVLGAIQILGRGFGLPVSFGEGSGERLSQ
ncbi:hypothetical protein GALL_248670 [mine drainage metagenome]|uniref:Uncharacterized protein n=1 Tax=mine drainage metagenome TaxID=410659 RepID=A0A1J5RBJ0_9ZZZZ